MRLTTEREEMQVNFGGNDGSQWTGKLTTKKKEIILGTRPTIFVDDSVSLGYVKLKKRFLTLKNVMFAINVESKYKSTPVKLI